MRLLVKLYVGESMDNCCRFAFYDCAQIRIQVKTCENLQKHAVVK